MGSISKSFGSLAAGGGLIALVSIAGCGPSGDARANGAVSGGAAAETAMASLPDTANAPVTGAFVRPAAPVAAAGTVARATLCAAGETAYFSCEIGAKRVSVCGDASGAVYRYGTPGKVELSLRSLAYANRAYSGGGESQITATNDGYTYTVYDSTVRTAFGEAGNAPEFSSGLVVARKGRIISSKTCKGEATGAAAAERALPAGSFVEH